MAGVESADQLPVGSSRRLEFFIAFLQLTDQGDNLLFEVGDVTFELGDVIRRPEAGLPPCLLAKEFGELGLQVPDAGGKTVAAVQGVRQKPSAFRT
ncbi:hypothetical protein ABZY09_46390 [Streptomyces sp. NPDC002928]|uniref:hypothetical protein n=1 Tax=Streptomyces sp. NPDC002928 TaxID=3154440 RepID=UPI0033B8EBF3